jgi:hypothetical protein
MTIPVYSGTVPNPVQSQPEFDTNTQEFIDYMAALAPALNDFAETISSVDTTSTSTTSLSIGTGTKNFTVETGKSYFVGMSLKIANTATNYMVGDVISYNSGTGALSVNVVATSGTGTYSSWTLTLGFSGLIDTAQIADGAVTADKVNATVATVAGVQTLTNKTLTSPTLTTPTVTNYTETLFTATGNTTINLANGTIQKITTTGNNTITLPSSVTGKSYVVIIAYAGVHTVTWAGGSTIKWNNGSAPVQTSTNGKFDIFTFFCDGTNTYGSLFGRNF